jgi:nitroimidazol reductase NimA-like FMN-containing flavoprotein (pyridoxamine 5'-phosphate oxidase superfamily)
MSEPRTDFDGRYSAPRAAAVAWTEAEADLRSAELYWLTTVRADGRPHVTPLIAVWRDGALHISTGRSEQKARNIAEHPGVAVTTGRNDLVGGRDMVVEGEAVRVTDRERLQELADDWETKYGPDWHFEVGDGGFLQGGAPDGLVFRIEPRVAYAFGKEPYSHTRFSWTSAAG